MIVCCQEDILFLLGADNDNKWAALLDSLSMHFVSYGVVVE